MTHSSTKIKQLKPPQQIQQTGEKTVSKRRTEFIQGENSTKLTPKNRIISF